MKTVLLAYEREQDLNALETLLQSRGHRVQKARSGIEALEMARREAPHVLVSDVLLPRLDGFALCRRIKDDPLLQHVAVVLMSFRVEGPKYEAFAAEVGAERFLQRGATLEDLAAAIDDLSPGSGTMRMPALVPELLERREQDRRRLAELDRQLKDLEAVQQQLAASERVAREKAEKEARERTEAAAADAARIQELQGRLRELERREQALARAEEQARWVSEQSRSESTRVSVLEARLADLQSAQARAQAAAVDAERAFVMQPVPTWLSDIETHEIRALSDSAAALFGIPPEQLRGRSIVDLLPGYAPGVEPARPVDVTLSRADGSSRVLELNRHSVSYAGRGCWLTAARDVTVDRTVKTAHDAAEQRTLALELSPVPVCVADADGRLRYANIAFCTLLGLDAGAVSTTSLQQFDTDEAPVSSRLLQEPAPVQCEGRWRRTDGTVVDVEAMASLLDDPPGARVVGARDVSARGRLLRLQECERRRVATLLELTQQAHSMTEPEVFTQALALLEDLTGSPVGHAFLALQDPTQLELTACRGNGSGGQDLSVLARWRGSPPQETALFQCLSSQRTVTRDVTEGTGSLRQAGLPASFRRQLCVPMLDGGRTLGVIALADKASAYGEDDQRHAVEVAAALAKIVRRRRSDTEVVSAMDHMERVMLGVIESLATLAEAQDACKIGRSRRVAEIAAAIGTTMGLPGHTVRGLRVMGQLIDVGMLQIPREILWRPGQLTVSEYELVKTHVERGYESLRRIEFPWPVADVVRQHHERIDGSGYPRGLRGDEILLEARIVAVADAAEAMLAPRPQRAALSLAACIEELQSQAGRRYDARVVKACVKVLRERETPTEVVVPVGQRIA